MASDSFHYSTLTHIGSYPMVQEITDFVLSWNIIKNTINFVCSFLSTRLSFLQNYQSLVKYWNAIDFKLESLLTKLDERYPMLKLTSFNMLYYGSQKIVYESSISISNMMAPYIMLVLGYFDPILRITNKYYEYFLNTVLPRAEYNVATLENETKTEFQKMIKLMLETLHRIQLAASQVSKIPSHVSNTYQNELKDKNTSTLQAVSKTTRKLSTDAYETIKPAFYKVVGSNESGSNANMNSLIDSSPVVATGVEVH